jgi:phospho-N-acetylmuramoyl-pentapeptide-transferase
MIRPLLAFAGSLLCGLLLYPAVISTLARLKAGQRVQSYGPASHLVKAGTPTMGGILFCTLPIAAWLLLDHGRAGFLVVFAIVAGATIGVVDDLANIRGRGALGLLGRQKLVLQMLVGLLLGIGLDAASLTREVIPGAGAVDLHWGIIPLAALAVVACSNAVNLTDGVDGLAGSCSVIALVAIWAMAQHAGNRPVAIVAASLTGGVLAFLFYNWWPARVFMGDTGSLALGCALVALAAELRLLWLLPLLGAVFVAETLSVIINVTAIRRFGRRVFRASPLHHHFEELGLREQRLVVCFAGAAAVAALLCAALAVPSGVGAGGIGGVPHP